MTDSASTKPDEVLYFGNRIPFLESIGVQPNELRLDYASARLSFNGSLANSAGGLHGGSLMTALDFAMSAAARSSDPAGLAPSTVDMRTSFIRPAESDVEIVARCVHRGRSIAFCEATAHNNTNELVAMASGVFKLFRKSGTPHAD
jgi:uncharacterized protein (TIGR00369 family)